MKFSSALATTLAMTLAVGTMARPRQGPLELDFEESNLIEEAMQGEYVPPKLTPSDRFDMPFGGGGGGHLPSFPHIPGFGALFGQRMPFDQISGPYVSSSIGRPFTAGPFGGLAIPFSPGPLGGIMGVPLALLTMG